MREMGVPLAVLAIVMAMIAPLPSFLLDVLISTNITISIIVLLVSMYITKPVDFSVFPTTLLLMTLFRLALNISSSRLILLNGNSGTAAAGDVIEAFGNFVVGGNYAIGVVIFLVLIAIQYVVINHGAVRISEVTARFTWNIQDVIPRPSRTLRISGTKTAIPTEPERTSFPARSAPG